MAAVLVHGGFMGGGDGDGGGAGGAGGAGCPMR